MADAIVTEATSADFPFAENFYVGVEGIATDEGLAAWVQRGGKVHASLPSK